MLLSKAHRLLGILEGIARFNKKIEVIESLSIKREALRSCHSEDSQVFEKAILYPDKKRAKVTFDIPGVFINLESYNPTASEDIIPEMMELEKYMRSKQPVDELIKIALFIYQFITISPFNTDNKKLCRILLPFLLIESSILSKQLICYSDFISQDPIGFYNRLASVRVAGDYMEKVPMFNIKMV